MNDPFKRKLLIAGLGLVILGAVLAMWRTANPPSPPTNLKPFEGVGAVAAEETVKMLQGRGRIVIVAFAPGPEKMRRQAREAELRSFTAVIAKEPDLTIAGVELIDNADDGKIAAESALTAAQYWSVAGKYPGVDAIVSLAGVPALRADDAARSGGKQARLVAVTNLGGPYRRMFEEHLLHVLILPKPDAGKTGARSPESARDWFDAYYMVVTPETSAGLPDRP